MHRRGQETLSLGPSKFRNYDPLTMTRVHMQLNYKCKLRVDHAVVVDVTGSRPVYAWRAPWLARMENAIHYSQKETA